MNEEITASYLLTTDAMLPALRWHQQKLLRVLWWPVLGVIMVFILVGLFQDGFQTKDAIMTVVAIPLVLAGLWLWFFLMKNFLRSSQSRNIKSAPTYGKMMHWTVTNEALKCNLDNASSTLPWSQVYKSVETPDGVLIYLQKMLFNWLPKTAFTSEADYTRLLELLAAKTKHSRIG
jgi:hypothetical protein